MMRKSANKSPRPARVKKFPAPVKGWIANQNLAIAEPQGAAMLENWFPTATGVRLRKGNARHAIINTGEAVVSLFSYANGANKSLFCATETGIYNITSPESDEDFVLSNENNDELVDEGGNFIGSDSLPPASVTSLTGGAWVSAQFATPGGVFLRLVNGQDTSLVYDGSTFNTALAITGVSSNTLSYVWAFKNRLWFVQKDTLNAAYLNAVDAISGAASLFPLGGVFQLGGSLLFGASWSLDENSGLSASNVFVTTEGEVAVYQGSNPASATDFTLRGVYRIGRPLGPNAFIRAGGDLIIATEIGFVPLSQAIQRDVAALAPAAVSYPIETVWNNAVATSQGAWTAVLWPSEQMTIVCPPAGYSRRGELFVANSRTGAWCLFTGQKINCLHVYDGRCFYGSTDGRIVEMETTGSDEGSVYTGTVIPLFDDLRSPAQAKIPLLGRATLIAPSDPPVTLSCQFDYNINLLAAPDASPTIAGSVWGGGVWGSSTWGAQTTRSTFQRWNSVGGYGYAVAPSLQISSGGLTPPNIDLVSIDLTYETADIVS
jgi:hypothetical protein